jgi:DNA (cytosine-5)-methyltransferase 1
MIATSGRNALASSGLSKKDPLGACSKTLMVIAIWGSIERSLIWKPWATPGGRFGFRLAPSARPMTACGSGSSPKGWTTPQAHDAQGWGDPKRWRRFGGKHGGANLPDEVAMAVSPWPTPRANESTGAQPPPGRQGGPALKTLALSAPWPTPRVCSGERSSGMNRTEMYRAGPANWPTPGTDSFRSRGGERKDEMGLDQLARRSVVAPWSTPTQNDSANLGAPSQFCRNSQALNVQAKANWSTPRATDGAKGGPNQAFGAGGQPLPAQAAQTAIRGDMPSGSNAPTENSGALNPAWVCWLMGYPNGWLD